MLQGLTDHFNLEDVLFVCGMCLNYYYFNRDFHFLPKAVLLLTDRKMVSNS